MDETIVDRSVLEQLALDLGGDPAPVQDLIQSYLLEAPSVIRNLYGAVEKRRVTEVTSAAHSLKSTSATFGASGLAQLALDLEVLGRKGVLDEAPEKVDSILRLYPAVEAELRQWVEALR